MAENTNETMNQNVENEVTEATVDSSTNDIQSQLQALMLENARLKRANNKASSEASNYKKLLRERQSEEERASMEKAEMDAEREERYNELLRKSNINDLEKNYLAQGYTLEEATKMATAEVDGDIDSKFKIMSEVSARQKKEYEAEWLKSRPQASIGNGESHITKEQFDSMNLAEKSKLFRENKTEYDRLKNL